jgi:hypothetical protein
MRNYWIRIAIGALGVFTAGLIIVTVAKHGKMALNAKLESSDPITLPLAFLPFKVDQQQLGTFSKVIIMRSDPKHVSGLHLTIDLKQPGAADRFKNCTLVSDLQVDTKGKNFDVQNGSFRCVTDTAGMKLVRFGDIMFHPAGDMRPFLIPADVAEHLRSHAIDINISGKSDSMSQMADSMAAMAESLSINAESIRIRVQRVVDSAQVKQTQKPTQKPKATQAPQTH